MEPALLALAGWLDTAGMRHWASATPWVYPAANVLHVIGVAALVGAIGIVDLRVAGLWRALPAEVLSRALTPIAVAGFVILVLSGFVLFAADGAALAASAVFRLKLAMLAAAIINAAAFRVAWQGRVEAGLERPFAARISAMLSLLLWLTIATLGRLIAYT